MHLLSQNMDKLFVLFVITIGILDISCLKINELKVPELIENGTQNELILDCDYDISDSEADGLVVKWFYDNTQHVYQWIPGGDPQVRGMLKGKLDLHYKASDSPKKMFRALKIKEITPQLTGNYTCSVSTFYAEDQKTKKMVIYVKEDKFELQYEQIDDDTLRLICSAEDIYPRPNITIYDVDKPILDTEFENVTLGEDHLWDISTSVTVDVNEAKTFICVLQIPEANYTVRKEFYYSSQEVTEMTSSSSEMSLQMAGEKRDHSGANWICFYSPWILLLLPIVFTF